MHWYWLIYFFIGSICCECIRLVICSYPFRALYVLGTYFGLGLCIIIASCSYKFTLCSVGVLLRIKFRSGRASPVYFYRRCITSCPGMSAFASLKSARMKYYRRYITKGVNYGPNSGLICCKKFYSFCSSLCLHIHAASGWWCITPAKVVTTLYHPTKFSLTTLFVPSLFWWIPQGRISLSTPVFPYWLINISPVGCYTHKLSRGPACR